MWRPMRRKGAGVMQLMLMALGLAFVIRNVIQLVVGTERAEVGANVTASVTFHGLHIGRTELWVVIVAFAVLSRSRRCSAARASACTSARCRTTPSSRRRPASTPTGSSSTRGSSPAAWRGSPVSSTAPRSASSRRSSASGSCLSMFAAVIVGGIGDAYGALAGGILIGLVQEWSTLVFPVNLKVAVGFGAMILVLILRPQGIFGHARSLADDRRSRSMRSRARTSGSASACSPRPTASSRSGSS